MEKFYKYVKLLGYFAALIGNLVWQNTTWGSVRHVSLAFIFASFCYLAVALFALLRPLIGWLFGLIATVSGLFGLAWIGDWIIEQVSFVNEDIILWIFVILVSCFLIKDIVWIYNYLKSEWRTMKKINRN